MFTRFKNCLCEKKVEIIPILLFHRLLWVFLFFGWMFDDKLILGVYLIFILSLQTHWMFNKNQCFITQIERNICNLPENSYSDYLFNFFDTDISFYYGLIQIITCSIVVYKLIK